MVKEFTRRGARLSTPHPIDLCLTVIHSPFRLTLSPVPAFRARRKRAGALTLVAHGRPERDAASGPMESPGAGDGEDRGVARLHY